ncbi:PRC-barrel domain containing protein [Streptomyces sp. NBC_01361]|nr:PRC-barrel domain containing protein [Streptomyces sp. NBC_01361]
MIRAADVREWRSYDVVDQDGRKIGALEALNVNTRTDEPAVATVLIRLPRGTGSSPFRWTGAVVGPAYVKIDHAKALVKESPSIGTDDMPPAEDEEPPFRLYGLPYKPGANGERRLARR